MHERSAAGAQQAYRFYFQTLIHAMQSGSADGLMELGAESCVSCKENRDRIRDDARIGQRWTPTQMSDEHLAPVETDEYEAVVDYDFTLSAHSEPEDGRMVQKPRQRYMTRAGLEWEGGRWRVARVGGDVEDLP